VVRATIVLAAGEGVSNARIAADLGLHIDTVRKWRRRFWQRRLAGLADLPRSGRPRRFSAVQVAEVKALACELPAESDLPLAKWSCPDLAAEAGRRGVVASVSASTVRRWLAADAIRPESCRLGRSGWGDRPLTCWFVLAGGSIGLLRGGSG
jgi:transposase